MLYFAILTNMWLQTLYTKFRLHRCALTLVYMTARLYSEQRTIPIASYAVYFYQGKTNIFEMTDNEVTEVLLNSNILIRNIFCYSWKRSWILSYIFVISIIFYYMTYSIIMSMNSVISGETTTQVIQTLPLQFFYSNLA